MIDHAYNYSTQTAEAGGLFWVWGQLRLQTKILVKNYGLDVNVSQRLTCLNTWLPTGDTFLGSYRSFGMWGLPSPLGVGQWLTAQPCSPSVPWLLSLLWGTSYHTLTSSFCSDELRSPETMSQNQLSFPLFRKLFLSAIWSEISKRILSVLLEF